MVCNHLSIPFLQLWFTHTAIGVRSWMINYISYFNSLAHWHVIFKQILVIDGWDISCEIALIWISPDFTDDQSTLVQVMAWCRQATSHYLSQCWPRSLSPYGITRPKWVNVAVITYPCPTFKAGVVDLCQLLSMRIALALIATPALVSH